MLVLTENQYQILRFKDGGNMNKRVVMSAIAREMNFWFDSYNNPKNDDNGKKYASDKIKDLYEAYMELRGHKGIVVNIAGSDSEACDVDSIYTLTR